jgi:hypothetical protein
MFGKLQKLKLVEKKVEALGSDYNRAVQAEVNKIKSQKNRL